MRHFPYTQQDVLHIKKHPLPETGRSGFRNIIMWKIRRNNHDTSFFKFIFPVTHYGFAPPIVTNTNLHIIVKVKLRYISSLLILSVFPSPLVLAQKCQHLGIRCHRIISELHLCFFLCHATPPYSLRLIIPSIKILTSSKI